MTDTNNNMQGGTREYPHMLRGPRFAWWRPLLTLLLVLMFALALLFAMVGVFAAAGQMQAVRGAFSDLATGSQMNPVAFVFMNLCLGAMVPVSMLATRIVHGVAPGYVSSVAGRFRWRWSLLCTAVLVPLYALIFALDLMINGSQGALPAQQGLLLLLVLTTTPLQAAGEEYVFRGLIMQNVGAWFRNPRVALVAGTALSAGLFATAHGSTDVWILLDLAAVATGACILIWRTGGLEAAVVLHAVNNTLGMCVTILLGGWNEGFVSDASVGKPVDLLLTVLVLGAAVPLLLKLAKRYGVQREYVPAADQPTGDATGSRRMNAWMWIAVAVPVPALIVSVVAVGLVQMRKNAPALVMHYADIAKPLQITPEGCVGVFQMEYVPMKISHYYTRQPVEEEVVLHLGNQFISGEKGEFRFPVSGELLAQNPELFAAQQDGTKLRVQLSINLSSDFLAKQERCPTSAP